VHRVERAYRLTGKETPGALDDLTFHTHEMPSLVDALQEGPKRRGFRLADVTGRDGSGQSAITL
jgi:hypothetical protein